MSIEEDNPGSILTNPLSIKDLVKDGIQFEINTNFDDNLSNELFDYFNIDEIDNNEEACEVIISPWEKSFIELREQMMKINDNLYKRITQSGDPKFGKVPDHSHVVVHYNAYWEKETAPFDSSYMRGQPHKIYCGQNQIIQGFEDAIRTMLKGEEAQFLISYRLLFGEMGCPPRVKAKADALFIIKLLDFTFTGDDHTIDSIREEDTSKFSVMFEKIKNIHCRGVHLFKLKNIKTACRLFHEAATTLEFCKLDNEQEEKEQKEFLIKLYINLAICYNRLNLPLKACCMCNEIRKLTNINQNCKALFQEGRALLMIGEFIKARKKLLQAQRLEPRNQEISKELKLLDQKYEEYKSSERNLCKKALGIIEQNDTKKMEEGDRNYFKEEIRQFFEKFKEKENSSDQLTLPFGLSADEINNIEELVDEFELKLSVTTKGNSKSYVISKPSKKEKE